MTVQDDVVKVIAKELGVEEGALKPETTFKELDADSLDLVELAMALEDRFRAELAAAGMEGIPDRDAAKLLTVKDAVAYMEEVLAKGKQ